MFHEKIIVLSVVVNDFCDTVPRVEHIHPVPENVAVLGDGIVVGIYSWFAHIVLIKRLFAAVQDMTTCSDTSKIKVLLVLQFD